VLGQAFDASTGAVGLIVMSASILWLFMRMFSLLFVDDERRRVAHLLSRTLH